MEFEQIYKTHFKDIYIFLCGLTQNKTLAQDITQETFLKAMDKIHTFDEQKDIKAWLFTIARNTYYTEYNREKRLSPYGLHEHTHSCTNILDDLILEEQSFLILTALHHLKEPYKEIFMLRFFGNLSFQKISLIFSKSENWARVTYYRAKKQIINQMEEQKNG